MEIGIDAEGSRYIAYQSRFDNELVVLREPELIGISEHRWRELMFDIMHQLVEENARLNKRLTVGF